MSCLFKILVRALFYLVNADRQKCVCVLYQYTAGKKGGIEAGGPEMLEGAYTWQKETNQKIN